MRQPRTRKFADKSLPTIYHWSRAAGKHWIRPGSSFR